MALRTLSRTLCALVLYFALHGLFAIMKEMYSLSLYIEVLALFPATKLLGDVVLSLIERSPRYGFWEDWLRDMGLFTLLAIPALVSAEFWKNFLQLAAAPDLTLVAILAYLIMDIGRRGDKPKAYELS